MTPAEKWISAENKKNNARLRKRFWDALGFLDGALEKSADHYSYFFQSVLHEIKMSSIIVSFFVRQQTSLQIDPILQKLPGDDVVST